MGYAMKWGTPKNNLTIEEGVHKRIKKEFIYVVLTLSMATDPHLSSIFL
jgi:hypothetical protein